MRYGTVDLPRIAVIGREGFCTKEKNVARELWLRLAGAVCDFTEPATGQNKLFFPTERMEEALE